MKMLDLFSGIGGFHLAAEWTWGDELEVVGHVEIDKFCQKVLKKHWPDVPIYEDIKNVKGEQFGTVYLITGGFPCQPFSVAGKRKGSEDDRAIWPEMFRIIQEVKPRWVVGENVTGIIHMELDKVLADLEGEGYETETFIIPACGVDAPHRRNRVWVVANSRGGGFREQNSSDKQQGRTEAVVTSKNIQDGRAKNGEVVGNAESNDKRRNRKKSRQQQVEIGRSSSRFENVADTESRESREQTEQEGRQNSCRGSKEGCRDAWWAIEPNVGMLADGLPSDVVARLLERDGARDIPVCRVATGIPKRVDKLKALGNAIVPQVVYPIMQAIKEIDEYTR